MIPNVVRKRSVNRHAGALTCGIIAALVVATGIATAKPSPVPPDLTKDQAVDRERTYNLGATGMRGWIHTRPDSYLDSEHGRTTLHSRQILVTHVGAKSPADGVMQVNDVILGVAGQLFNADARKSLAQAIQEAEKPANGGLLKLTCWRAGKTSNVTLKLRVMGSYAATAPYKCAKSKLIFDDACKVLEKESLPNNWAGAISGLALMATGEPKYLPRVRELAHTMAPQGLDLQQPAKRAGMVTWDWGYRTIFLCEYYLLTGDRLVAPAIREYTIALATGQSMYGTFGHGVLAPPTSKDELRSVPPYGPVNSAGLPANIAIVLGKKCGVQDPAVDLAIARANKFFGYFVDKGIIPYGEHIPGDTCHDHNGKTAMAAMLFALQDNQPVATRFFARMVTASHQNREVGHTGQGFSYLWGALGAATGGPAAAAAFFQQASWHFDLVRRCDGSFTYDGGEQYGPGKTSDDTYYGDSSYDGLSPAASYVLTYSLPLRKIHLTGKASNPANLLTSQEIIESIAAGRYDQDRHQQTAKELVAMFGSWSPVVRNWAAEELAGRPEAAAMVPQLITMAEGKDVHIAQGAVGTLGYLKCAQALPTLCRLLSHDDRWLRYKAANAIRKIGGAAKSNTNEVVQALITTAEPLQPIAWADPIQFTHGELAAALFGGPLQNSLQDLDTKLRYQAIRIIAQNADGMARMHLRGYFEHQLSEQDVQALAPDIYAAVKTSSPADTMFANEIRMGGMQALTKYHFTEGIDSCVYMAKFQGGHGSESRTGQIMKQLVSYGTAARRVIPQLEELIVQFNDECRQGFPENCNIQRVTAVQEAIKTLQNATTQPDLHSTSTPPPHN